MGVEWRVGRFLWEFIGDMGCVRDRWRYVKDVNFGENCAVAKISFESW